MSWKRARKELWEIISGLFFAFFVWISLGALLGTATPLSDVSSCSMVPRLYPGDMVILSGAWIDQMQLPVVDSNFEYIHEVKTMTENGISQKVKVTTGVKSGGDEIRFSNGPTIVYVDPKFSKGPIVHQAVAKVKTPNGYALITKGVNNTRTDQEAGISLVTQDKILGQVMFKIPFIGYIKTILFGTLDFKGCDRVYEDTI